MPSMKFSVRCDTTKWGEQVAVVGSWNSWDHNKFTPLSTTPDQFPIWTASFPLPQLNPDASIEYKYVIVADGRLDRWESNGSRNNRVAKLTQSHLTDIFGKVPSSSNNDSHQQVPQSAHPNQPINTDHSSLLDPLESAILDTTVQQRSWRQRLAFIRSLFTDDQIANDVQFDNNSLDHLVTVSVYLTFLASGQLRCEEDGGHHRPNHHANEAQQIERALANITSSVIQSELADASSPSASYIPYVVRKIYPQLPSYSSQFTVSVPLTRIRDIAHRGDIDHNFKQEIKHTLQNKLHRCAGPEDLQTSKRLLDRINHGNYSHDLKEQFRIFHDELRAFFNSSSLDERLHYLEHSYRTREVAGLASSLLGLKHGWREASVQLDALTKLRRGISSLDFMQSRASGGSDLPGEDMQKTRLADIDLENFAFVLLAGIAKDVEAEGASKIFNWSFALKGLAMALENMSLSSICPKEASATASELMQVAREHIKSNSMPHRALLLRTKAAVDRSVRFIHNFSAAISNVYTRRVESLGSALNIDQHSLSVFAEAEIRSNVAFQASRLVDMCAKVYRRQLNLPPWDPLFVGSTSGKLVFVDSLSDISSKADGHPLVTVCRHADGDEDIPSHVRGVILGRPIPHLSHLGVRARQAGVVFVCAEEKEVFEVVWNQRDLHRVRLVVTETEGVSTLVEESEQVLGLDSQDGDKSNGKAQTHKGKITFDGRSSNPMPIEEATQETTSSKSTFAGRLCRLGDNSDGLFVAPTGVALPHGIFQKQLSKHSKIYDGLVREYEEAWSGGGDADTAASSLYEFIRTTFTISDKTSRVVQNCFQKGVKVMVRSSANAEDLEEMSGAGLYDSIANVDVYSNEDLREAIANVWASLWTKRAASSRASYGVGHEDVSMAVLIQEMVVADASFVAFSKDPVIRKDYVYIEMAIGMGETLASATSEGSPYRFRVKPESNEIETIAFASYAEGLVPGEHGLQKRIIDYSKERLTVNAEFRANMVRGIAQSIRLVEKEFGGPQDVEGAIAVRDGKARIFLVQARPQIL